MVRLALHRFLRNHCSSWPRRRYLLGTHQPESGREFASAQRAQLFLCCAIILGLYSALYAATYLLPLFMQQMMGYDATTAGFALAPAGLFTMMEVPFVGYMLTRGFDARKMAFVGMLVIIASFFWMSSLNLEISEASIVWPRIVQVLGVGVITVPISTIIFRFLPATESSQAAGIYALMRNEGGSLGIAFVTTMLERKSQLHQQILAQHVTASNGLVRQYLAPIANAPGNAADHHRLAMTLLYNAVQRQALLLSYMDQFRLLAGIILCMLPLVFFLKRPQAQKQMALEAR